MAAAARRRLGPQDWIDAARRALVDAGPAGVAVEALAKRLGVTKGSFYWHFKDRAALCEALVADWERATARAVMAALESAPGGAKARLTSVISSPAVRAQAGLEAAVRGWALTDADVARAVRAADARRQELLAALLANAGVAPAAASALARLIIITLAGEAQMIALGAPSDDAVMAFVGAAARELAPARSA